MADLSISFHNLSFTYDRATQPLLQNLSVHFTQGWTGIVGANGVGKSTILKLATGGLKPQKGRVVLLDFAIYCPQRTDMVPEHLYELIHAMDGDAFEIKGRLGLENDWIKRWATLSHGERKRAQIAVALWRKPQVLAVDEPTNHLDLPSIECLEQALGECPCGLFLVSHDRRFLDALVHKQWHISEDNRIKGDCTLEIQ